MLGKEILDEAFPRANDSKAVGDVGAVEVGMGWRSSGHGAGGFVVLSHVIKEEIGNDA